MKIAASLALLLFATATPATATGGMRCAPMSGAGPVVTLTLGHAVAPQLVGAMLEDGRLTLRTGGLVETATLRSLAISQSWIDERRLWLDLVDGNSERYEARLRATFQPRLRGRPAVGTLVRHGRTWRVRCEEA